jgi:hypothetical protein
MQRINLTCQTCNKVYDLPKTEEIPAHVFQMKCNWCPVCEDQADDYYNEWWDENENDTEPQMPVPDNQLCMPFIFDELELDKNIAAYAHL